MRNNTMLDMEAVCLRFNKTRQTIYAWVRNKTFPQPVQPGGKKGHYYWPRETIDQWEKQQETYDQL